MGRPMCTGPILQRRAVKRGRAPSRPPLPIRSLAAVVELDAPTKLDGAGDTQR